MLLGGLLVLAGVACYIANVMLLGYYIEKGAPGLLEVDASLPRPRRGEHYLWEYTAGTGMVPKWVSVIGVTAILLAAVGVVVFMASFCVG